jgi:hypothetical protein
MITEVRQSTVQLVGGPKCGTIVRLKKSKLPGGSEKMYSCLNERCYQSLYSEGHVHVYELRPIPPKSKGDKSKKVICRFYHCGMAEVSHE